MRKIKFNFYYFQECNNCGNRLQLEAQSVGSNNATVFERTDYKCFCGDQNWNFICIVNKKEILPKA